MILVSGNGVLMCALWPVLAWLAFELHGVSVFAYKARFDDPWSNYWIYIPIKEHSWETQICVELNYFWWAVFVSHILVK